MVIKLKSNIGNNNFLEFGNMYKALKKSCCKSEIFNQTDTKYHHTTSLHYMNQKKDL